MDPAGAVAIEVADQVGIVAKLGTMGPGHIVAPLGPLGASIVVVTSVLLPLMRFGERQQVTIRHVEGLVLFVGERAGMPPLPYGHFLDPADGIEAPALQIRSHRLLDPFDRAPVVLLPPKMNVLRITHRCRVDMVDAEREERLPIRRNEPPMILPSTESEESLRLALRGLRRCSQSPRVRPRHRARANGECGAQKTPSVALPRHGRFSVFIFCSSFIRIRMIVR